MTHKGFQVLTHTLVFRINYPCELDNCNMISIDANRLSVNCARDDSGPVGDNLAPLMSRNVTPYHFLPTNMDSCFESFIEEYGVEVAADTPIL